MTLNTIVYEKFRNAFEQKCYQLIVDAYQTSLIEKKYKLDWIENDFSELLNHYIGKNPFSIKYKIFCKTENKIFKDKDELEKGYADKLSRIDFVYSIFTKGERFEYFMEAKNLKQNDSALKRRYIDTGINNFISKKYENGSLIGYLLDGKTNETIISINSLLEKDRRNTETLIFKPNNLIKNYCESNHSDIGTLKHLIFDFTNA